MTAFRLMVGDALEQLRTLPDSCVQTCVASPPYWGLRDYGVEGQIGLEPTSGEFIGRLLEVFREVRRVLRPDGTAWVNLGDTYASSGWGGGIGTTHTHLDEPGTSLRAAGWVFAGLTHGGEHSRPSRPRAKAVDSLPKKRWFAPGSAALP